MGAVGPKSMALLRDVGRRIAEETGESHMRDFLFQWLSVAVQRGNCASVLGTITTWHLLFRFLIYFLSPLILFSYISVCDWFDYISVCSSIVLAYYYYITHILFFVVPVVVCWPDSHTLSHNSQTECSVICRTCQQQKPDNALDHDPGWQELALSPA